MLANFSNLITFSRGSNATVTDASGRLTYAANNLVTNSQDFEAAAWTKLATTVASNAMAAPDGSITADTVTEAASTTWHAVFTGSPPTIVSGQNYTLSVYLKAGTRRYVQLALGALGAGQQQNFGVVVDTGVTPMRIVSTGNGTSGTYVASSVQDAGSGWYRISVTGSVVYTSGFFSVSGAAGDTYSINPVNNGSGTYSVWGAQLEAVTYQTTPSPYVSTSVANLLGFSEAFDNAAWTKTRASIVTGAAQNPINNLWNAQKLMEDTTASNTHFTRQTISVPAGPVVFSIYAKAAERSTVRLVDASYGNAAYFNLSNGTVGTTDSATGTIVAIGGGWYRCSISYTSTVAGNHSYDIRLTNGTTGGSDTYTGDGNSGIYIYGAQLSNSGSLDPYVPTPGAAPSSTAYYGPRFDYDPVTLAAKGILIEEQRTNLLTYSETLNAAPWTNNGVSIVQNASTSPSGLANAAKVTENSANSVHELGMFTPTTGTAYAISFYAKAAGRSQISFSGGGFAAQGYSLIFDVSNGTTVINTGSKGTITPVGNGWYRCVVSFTTSNTIGFSLLLAVNTATTYQGDGTSGVLLWGAQIEAGAFATSYIPTVASQVTRTADVASITGSLFSQWYRQDQGTFVVSGSTFNPLTNSGRLFWADRSSGTVYQYAIMATALPGSGIWQAYVSDNGAQATLNAITTATSGKISLAYNTNDFASSFNGNTPATDNSGTVPTGLDVFRIGSHRDTTFLNGHIQNITYIPNRISNDQLQAATS